MKLRSLKWPLRSMSSLIALRAACGVTEPGTAPRSRVAERAALASLNADVSTFLARLSAYHASTPRPDLIAFLRSL